MTDKHAKCFEQVNRLTRELTALRAQSASVASNASQSSTSTSASLLPVDISDPNPTHQMMGATHPTPSRRHRSSSSVSGRSIPTPSTSISNTGSTQAQAGSTMSSHPNTHGGISQASVDRAAAATGGTSSTTLSRQPSISAQSGASTPARQSFDALRNPSMGGGGVASGGTLYTLPHRPSISRDASYAASTTAAAGTPHQAPHPIPSPAQSPSQSVHAAMQHYTDTAAYRTEMEFVKAENDSLRQRVRALERALRTRRRDSSTSQSQGGQVDARSGENTIRVPREREANATSPSATSPNATNAAAAGIAAWAAGNGGVGGVAGPRERSESQSTTASSRRELGGVGIREDEVRFGESAGNVGIGR